MEVKVIGGGLAGAEAAYQLARRGISVSLSEMRPHATTPAHTTALLSELVCSNSLKSKELSNAHGLLKEELRILGSIVLKSAYESAIPGGKALVVDRNEFSRRVSEAIEGEPLIRVVREEVTGIPPEPAIIATGPLTSDRLAAELGNLTGVENLSFFDAVSPIIDGATVDMERAFFGSRYLGDTDDYLNCPFTREEYDAFIDALTAAERVSLRDFEKIPYFEGCLPIEVMAERGRKTLAFGPMKPVGLVDPRSDKKPYAVLQLRREDAAGSMYNMVGFQTKLTYGEQERVFRMIPGLARVLFLRHGSIHRNTYLNAPSALLPDLSLRARPGLFLAGQITGVEGYMESTAMGLMAGISACLSLSGQPFEPPPPDTCIGGLIRYITTPRKHFQPMNANFGLLPDYNKKGKERIVRQALESMALWCRRTGAAKAPGNGEEDEEKDN